MPTMFYLDEDDLNSRFADRRPFSDATIAKLHPYLYQEAEHAGKYYLINDWRGKDPWPRNLPCRLMALEFVSAEQRHQYVTEMTALAAKFRTSAMRGKQNFQERPDYRTWSKRQDDPGGEGYASVPSPLCPKPPVRPAKDAKELPLPENRTQDNGAVSVWLT